MYRFMNVSGQGQAERSKNYDGFPGKVIVVDLATVNGETEKFEGRDWLDGITRENKPVGWDLEWQPDRTKETDNPIALMQFADDKVALLLRTHRTRNWLPVSVMRTLLSESCKKVQVGWDGPDKQKMQSTFNFQPLGILDMAELAKVKGVAAQGLKSLSDHFGMKMQKDSRIARSNWADKELTDQQKLYAAEDAYFSFMLYQKLTLLPDAPLDRDPEQFKKVVHDLLDCVSEDMVDVLANEAFRDADKDGSSEIHFGDVAVWISSRSFSEVLNLTPEQINMRDLARQYDMTYAQVEQYKKCFDTFDCDGSGAIDRGEFEPLLSKCARLPKGAALPQQRTQTLWRLADLDGSHELDFQEFLVFYKRYFDGNGFENMYRFRRQPPNL